MLFTWDEWVEIAQIQAELDAANRRDTEKVVWEHTPPRQVRYEIQAQYGHGWKRFDPDNQPRYRYQDKAIARAERLAALNPYRPFRVVEEKS